MSSLVGGTVQRKNHGEIKEEGSFNPFLSKKSIAPPPHMAPTQSLIFQKNSVESPIKLMTERNVGVRDTEEENGSFEL